MSETDIVSIIGESLVNGLSRGIIVLDREYRILKWNYWMEKHSGIRESDIVGRNIFEIYPDIRERNKERYIRECIEKTRPYLLSPLIHHYLLPLDIVRDKEIVRMSQNVKIYPMIEGKDIRGCIMIVRDLTEQIFYEKEVARLNRVLAGIRNVNQLITRVGSEEELFAGACDILVRDIGYRFAWIGLIEEGHFDVIPVASAGIGPEPEDMKCRWDDSEKGRGLVGTAIKSGKTQIADGIQMYAFMKPWWHVAEKLNYQSACALPIHAEGRVIGTLHICASELHVFQSEELDLLEEVVSDISFSVETLRNRRKQFEAEKLLRENEARYRQMFENMSDGVAVYKAVNEGEDFIFLDFNKAAENIDNLKRDSVIGKNLLDVFPGIKAFYLPDVLRNVWKTGNSETFPMSFYKDERISGWRENLVYKLPGGEVVAIYSDQTKQKQAEEEKERLREQLYHSQKIEALGTLAGGIAHDFNNILGIIVGYAEMIKMLHLPEGSPISPKIDEILKASYRAKELAYQILTFCHKTDQEKESLQLSLIVKETLNFLRSTLPSTIEIRQRIENKATHILASPVNMHQMMMNLCTNAAHAMKEKGGILEVELSRTEMDTETAREIQAPGPGNYLRLTVRDTGHGIPSEIREKIFDPYFTTKKSGEGTGLGLAVVQGIVTLYNGAVTVESEPGTGSIFRVFFPAVEKEIRDEVKKSEPIPRGKESVLFIDDEKNLAELGQGMLSSLGYEVLAETSSIEALELFRSQPERFDLVITDQTMPHLTGDNLSLELMRIRPDIPIILCTGYSENISHESAEAIGIRKFILKPVRIRELAVAIREIFEVRSEE